MYENGAKKDWMVTRFSTCHCKIFKRCCCYIKTRCKIVSFVKAYKCCLGKRMGATKSLEIQNLIIYIQDSSWNTTFCQLYCPNKSLEANLVSQRYQEVYFCQGCNMARVCLTLWSLFSSSVPAAEHIYVDITYT